MSDSKSDADAALEGKLNDEEGKLEFSGKGIRLGSSRESLYRRWLLSNPHSVLYRVPTELEAYVSDFPLYQPASESPFHIGTGPSPSLLRERRIRKLDNRTRTHTHTKGGGTTAEKHGNVHQQVHERRRSGTAR
ncbi:unnamed protein product [Vitrella brassicaformis CCMP3155]|uniref:Uncharacterized protein n=1 Tax=Vitrella brassicaformis (strain CCMP3155) TaxID=1169540 RepID=A0A0G4F5A7_VITBC|nr:unnamed protein product [Vitrella brassicaformis CCMP3155]|eukprot:CEM07235.1 unnamed protein product [Vitrella brassicaformis CCMP3155]